MFITVKQRGDYKKIRKYLKKVSDLSQLEILNKYGEKGVQALESATPYETGLTAGSWYYEIEGGKGTFSITFKNRNIKKNDFNVALYLQLGHGTGTGGYVVGRDYINPAIQPVFDQMIQDLWEEVTSL